MTIIPGKIKQAAAKNVRESADRLGSFLDRTNRFIEEATPEDRTMVKQDSTPYFRKFRVYTTVSPQGEISSFAREASVFTPSSKMLTLSKPVYTQRGEQIEYDSRDSLTNELAHLTAVEQRNKLRFNQAYSRVSQIIADIISTPFGARYSEVISR